MLFGALTLSRLPRVAPMLLRTIACQWSVWTIVCEGSSNLIRERCFVNVKFRERTTTTTTMKTRRHCGEVLLSGAHRGFVHCVKYRVRACVRRGARDSRVAVVVGLFSDGSFRFVYTCVIRWRTNTDGGEVPSPVCKECKFLCKGISRLEENPSSVVLPLWRQTVPP